MPKEIFRIKAMFAFGIFLMLKAFVYQCISDEKQQEG